MKQSGLGLQQQSMQCSTPVQQCQRYHGAHFLLCS